MRSGDADRCVALARYRVTDGLVRLPLCPGLGDRWLKDPWVSGAGNPDDIWESYDVERDWTQSHDLATEMPDKLAELERLFLIQAARFNVLPLDVRSGVWRQVP